MDELFPVAMLAWAPCPRVGPPMLQQERSFCFLVVLFRFCSWLGWLHLNPSRWVTAFWVAGEVEAVVHVPEPFVVLDVLGL